jgi:hypothetical protein
MGTVINDSTSAADNPRQAVWISTRGGENSGNTSTGIACNWPVPKTIIATARAMTMNLILKLDRTIQRIISWGLSRQPGQLLLGG